MLCSRFISFHRTNLSCAKPSLKLLTSLCSYDQRTSYGRNLRNISDDCEIPFEELTNSKVKKMMTYKVVPQNESWRTKLVDELLGARLGTLETPLNIEEIETILNFACSS
jgi:hypothetical protein